MLLTVNNFIYTKNSFEQAEKNTFNVNEILKNLNSELEDAIKEKLDFCYDDFISANVISNSISSFNDNFNKSDSYKELLSFIQSIGSQLDDVFNSSDISLATTSIENNQILIDLVSPLSVSSNQIQFVKIFPQQEKFIVTLDIGANLITI